MNLGTKPIRRALLSVSDKTNLKDLGKFLEGMGVEPSPQEELLDI